MNVRLATPHDIENVVALMKKYHINSIDPEDKPDGFVTTNMSFEQMETLIVKERGITIAEEGGRVLSFAMAGSWDFWQEWGIFVQMVQMLPGHTLDGHALSAENTYQYGPICIDKSVRGTGVFESVFNFSLHSMSERFPFMITFVNQINPRSYNAHTNKAHMSTIDTFKFNNNDYYLLACPTK